MATNVNCRYCKGKNTVYAEVRLQDARAECSQCHRASRWIPQAEWRGVGFHSGQMKYQEQELAGRPSDLMTIARAAQLVDRHPNTISTRINLGDLPSYKPIHPGYHPKKAQRLVSRAEIMALYKMAQPLP